MSQIDDALMQWLRVQMLRLRSFDWGHGTWTTHWLKDGVAKFGSIYSVEALCRQLGVSENDILEFIDSPRAREEMSGRSFTASWAPGRLTLTWLEEGISQTKTEISEEYFEKEGKFFVTSRFVEKIVYVDNAERTVRDTGVIGPAEVPMQTFLDANKRIE